MSAELLGRPTVGVPAPNNGEYESGLADKDDQIVEHGVGTTQSQDQAKGLAKPSVDLDSMTLEALTSYVSDTIRLLDLEMGEDMIIDPVTNKLVKRRTIFQGLIVCSSNTTAYGHTAVEFALPKSARNHTVTLNDCVGVRLEKPNEKEYSGVVTYADPFNIVVQFDRSSLYIAHLAWGFTLRLKRDIATTRKMQNALRSLLIQPGNAIDFVRLRFGKGEVQKYPLPPLLIDDPSKGECFCNFKLNAMQKKAVTHALHNNLTIIHGPPGTGKTETLVEVALQLARNGSGQRILICTPSNAALDNIVLKLSTLGIPMVRLGHSARIKDARVKQFSVDGILSNMASNGIISQVQREIDIQKSAVEHNKGRLASNLHELQWELVKRESAAVLELFSNTQLVCGTLTSTDPSGIMKCLTESFFDAVIIDECSQALEPLCWVALPWAKKCIMAGDHCQLAPLVVQRESIENGLHVSLMEKLVEKHGDKACIMLIRQYRMHYKIMYWISQEFYDGNLVADPTVADHLLSDLPGVTYTDETSSCMIFVDTSGCKLGEHQGPTKSYGNCGEAEMTVILVKRLLDAGVSPWDVAVITPYRQQVEQIRASWNGQLPPGLEVQTVDSYQGREKEAIIFSFVRSNMMQQTGFISDRSRTNVAVSRARRLLCVIGDSSTLCGDPLINSLITYIKIEGVVRSGFEMMNEMFSRVQIQKSRSNANQQPKANKKKQEEEEWGTGSSMENKAGSIAAASTYYNPVPQTRNFSPFVDARKLLEEPHTDIVKKTDSGCTEPNTNSTAYQASQGAIKKTYPLGESHGQKGSKKKNQIGKAASSASEVKDSDADIALMDKAIKSNRICATTSCKAVVTMIFFDCKLCGKRYCIAHTLPEVHGCGTEAKKAARKEFVHPVPKELDDRKRKELRAKLDKKVASLSKERKARDGKTGAKK